MLSMLWLWGRNPHPTLKDGNDYVLYLALTCEVCPAATDPPKSSHAGPTCFLGSAVHSRTAL